MKSKKAKPIKEKKLIIVGDCDVGKTSLLFTFMKNQFPLFSFAKVYSRVVQKI